jgi:hypothetical protein
MYHRAMAHVLVLERVAARVLKSGWLSESSTTKECSSVERRPPGLFGVSVGVDMDRENAR